jgi:hypothetical protein
MGDQDVVASSRSLIRGEPFTGQRFRREMKMWRISHGNGGGIKRRRLDLWLIP